MNPFHNENLLPFFNNSSLIRNNGMNAKNMRNGKPYGYQDKVSSKPLTRLKRMSLYHFIGDRNQGTGISEQGTVNNFQFLILNF